LRIASFGATSSLRCCEAAGIFRRAPLVEVHIEEATDSVVVQWLLERRVELGFVTLPDERFDTLTLAEDELVAVLPATHPWRPDPPSAPWTCMDSPLSAPALAQAPTSMHFWPARGRTQNAVQV
jgi:DNA-binding transcriptional LysR family regulator